VIRELGSKGDIEQDLIQVDGRTIRETQDKVYYVLYKPAGCVTTLSDPETGRRSRGISSTSRSASTRSGGWTMNVEGP